MTNKNGQSVRENRITANISIKQPLNENQLTINYQIPAKLSIVNYS